MMSSVKVWEPARLSSDSMSCELVVCLIPSSNPSVKEAKYKPSRDGNVFI